MRVDNCVQLIKRLRRTRYWQISIAVVCVIVLPLTALTGCTTAVIPPQNVSHPVAIVITDYGKHSSLLLPDPHGGMEEYAFGDWKYFALSDKSVWTAAAALIHSPQATLGRRWLGMSADPSSAATLLGADRIETLAVDEQSAASLRHALDLEYARHIDSEIYNAEEKMHFVRCDESYNLFHNCNSVTAEWLRRMGVRTRGLALFSRFVVEK
jgi:hypothetical protein